MIVKGNQRGGGQDLATHLMNAFNNESIEVADVRGAIAQDLHGAFAEWRAHAKATKGREYLYSLSVSPDDRQGNLTREQYFDFLNRAEKRLGLSEQARAIVFHVKEGRLHCHAVYSRTDLEKLRFVQLSHDRQQLRFVVKGFARHHGLELPAGYKDRGLEHFNDHAKHVNFKENQQQERTGVSKAERMAIITEAWRSSDNGTAFVEALKDRGYHIARGDKKAYVVVDRYGEIHSLPRQIEGVTKKDIDGRLKDYPLAALPDVEAVQQKITEEREQADRAREERAREQLRETVMELEVPLPAERPTAEDKRVKLEEIQAARRAELERTRQALALTHITERDALADIQAAENTGVVSNRMKRQPKGVAAFLTRITGIQLVIGRWQKQEDRVRAEAQRQETAALQRKHLREQVEIKRRFRALDLIEKREFRSLQTTLNRQKIQGIGRQRRVVELGTTVQAARAKTGPITLPQQKKLEVIKETAREMTAPAPVTVEKEKGKQKGKLRGLFNRMADLFAGQQVQTGGGPKPKKPVRTRAPEKPAPEKARADIDQEALARYLKNRDEDGRQITPEKEPDLERPISNKTPVEPAPTATGIDQERLKDILKRAADKGPEQDKDLDPGRDPTKGR